MRYPIPLLLLLACIAPASAEDKAKAKLQRLVARIYQLEKVDTLSFSFDTSGFPRQFVAEQKIPLKATFNATWNALSTTPNGMALTIEGAADADKTRLVRQMRSFALFVVAPYLLPQQPDNFLLRFLGDGYRGTIAGKARLIFEPRIRSKTSLIRASITFAPETQRIQRIEETHVGRPMVTTLLSWTDHNNRWLVTRITRKGPTISDLSFVYKLVEGRKIVASVTGETHLGLERLKLTILPAKIRLEIVGSGQNTPCKAYSKMIEALKQKRYRRFALFFDKSTLDQLNIGLGATARFCCLNKDYKPDPTKFDALSALLVAHRLDTKQRSAKELTRMFTQVQDKARLLTQLCQFIDSNGPHLRLRPGHFGKLAKVTTDGDSATGTLISEIRGQQLTQPIQFVKKKDVWLIHLIKKQR